MSQLQNAAKPLIIRLNRGLDLSLVQQERDILSRWVLMTAVNLHLAEKARGDFPTNFVEMARGTDPIDRHLSVAVGMMADNRHAGFYERHSPIFEIQSDDRPFTTLPIGWFVIERVVFGFAMVENPMLRSILPYAGRDVHSELANTGLTLISSPNRPRVVNEKAISISALASLRSK